MVNANGNPTRARVGVQMLTPVVIDRTHPYFAPNNTHERERRVQVFTGAFETLSPATRRVLQAVKAALFKSYDSRRGYQFAPYVNRTAIAQELGRDSLVPYDIRMLRNLAAKRFVVETKRALPRKQYGDIWLGAGAEYVYAIPPGVLFGLLVTDPYEKERLAELTRLGAARAAQAAARDIRRNTEREIERYEAMLAQRAQYKQQSLIEKIIDWLHW